MKAITGYVAGGIGRITELHARYYAQSWQFGVFFEAKVANELANLMTRFDPARDGIWLAQLNGKIEGSMVIDGQQADLRTARLRFFILSDATRGIGFGNDLMQLAINHCREAGFEHIFLTTFAGLDAARHLYEKFNFQLTDEQEDTTWGVPVREQRFDLHF